MFILPILTLALFGFVLRTFVVSYSLFVFIILYYCYAYVYFTYINFGFVLHNWADL